MRQKKAVSRELKERYQKAQKKEKIGWDEMMAVKNKAQRWVFAGIKEIRKRLPFPILGFDSDNGSEFINDELLRYCEKEHITFTRSRPYRKNDSCYIERRIGR